MHLKAEINIQKLVEVQHYLPERLEVLGSAGHSERVTVCVNVAVGHICKLTICLYLIRASCCWLNYCL